MPMFSAILTALVFFPIMMIHVHNNVGTIRRCITTSRVHNVS
jgi:hypothetical protein